MTGRRSGGLTLALVVLAVASVGTVAAADGDTHVVHEGENLTLANGPNQTIRGESTLSAGTTIDVRLQSSGTASPFLRTENATVAADGSFETSVDLTPVDPGTEFELTLVYDGTTLHNETGSVVACDGDCEEPSTTTEADTATTLVYDVEQPTLAAGPGQTLDGRTSLDPGTVLTVRLRSSSAENPFLRTTEATVSDSGSFAARFDMTDLEPGTAFEIAVLQDGDELLKTAGEVVPCDGDCEQTRTATEEEWDTRVDVVSTDEVAISSIAEGVAGRAVPVQVSVGDRESVAVSVGGDDVNYAIDATVIDGTGDRKVHLLVNTSAVGDDDTPTLMARDAGDEVEIRNETVLDPSLAPLDAAEYPLAVYDGERVSATKAGAGTLVLHEDASLTPTDDQSTDDWTGETFGLGDTIVRAKGGQRTTLALGLADANAARLEIGGPEFAFRVNATVRDGNDDGTVGVLFDTTAIGDADSPTLVAADDGDSVTVTDEHLAAPPLSPGDYDVDVYRGTDAAGNPDDIGTLVVDESLATNTSAPPDGDPADGDTSATALLGGGALAAGGLLAIAGLALLLGIVRD